MRKAGLGVEEARMTAGVLCGGAFGLDVVASVSALADEHGLDLARYFRTL